ncbi:NAD(P)-binding protein [Eremomyces bilateralis CBS 781.70]|uniref:Short-chain dehydrogenase/reductase 3 n=1 Tax=Eremomyces bilateralis CBS 781.70 TaxID=1392243 RepID=A0A6G1G9G0_9PEZI|nr:NAD(P)-binding protein [Eremomyces bilateralis CBS 781.70]KAF1814725.1 NAD(P)-binding protein [Eremomyces bilateralis CBS 781.70]
MTAVQKFSIYNGKLQRALLDPLFTGPLWWALAKSPESVKGALVPVLTSVLSEEKVPKVAKALQWLFILGLVAKANRFLSDLALNHWRLSANKKEWVWDREVAVLTGGCSGIGLLVAHGLQQKGIKVAILDIQPLPKELKGYKNVKYWKCDVTKPEEIVATAREIKQIWWAPSILINNAGIGAPHHIIDIDHSSLTKIFGVNIMSHFTTVKEFLPDMLKKNKGHIVEVASLASFVSIAGITDYSATKAGVLAFSEGLNQELRHRYKSNGVVVTTVHPGWTATPLVTTYDEAIKKHSGDLLKPETVADQIVQQILSCRGAQLVIPRELSVSSAARGWTNWLQEFLRDTQKGVTAV